MDMSALASLPARAPLLTATVLTVAMVGTLGWQGYQFWTGEQQHQSRQATRAAPVTQAPRQQQPDIRLASIEFFGTAAAESEVALQQTENLPETNLRIMLRGVMAGDDEQPGSALIEDDRSRTEVYIIGDEIPGNARLRSVHANRIIIERSGRLENLYFPDLADSRGVNLAAVNEQIQQASTPQPQPSQAAPQSQRAMGTPQATDERREEIRQRLEELRQRLRDNN